MFLGRYVQDFRHFGLVLRGSPSGCPQLGEPLLLRSKTSLDPNPHLHVFTGLVFADSLLDILILVIGSSYIIQLAKVMVEIDLIGPQNSFGLLQYIILDVGPAVIIALVGPFIKRNLSRPLVIDSLSHVLVLLEADELFNIFLEHLDQGLVSLVLDVLVFTRRPLLEIIFDLEDLIDELLS